MKVAIAQIRCVPGDVASNCARIVAFAEEARGKGCDLVVFPEMVDTGYDMSRLGEVASEWREDRDGSPYMIARKAAHDHGIYLACGLSERAGDRIYNSTALFNPDGKLVGKYRKIHLAAYPLFKEDQYVAPGDSLETVPIGEMTCGLLICYDVRFPEVSRALTLKGAQALILSSAFAFPRVNQWRTLIRARAIENQVYVIAANRVGTDAGITFCGSSAIIDPYGVTVAEGAEDREELIAAEISTDLVRSVREYMPVLQQRREELY